MDMAVDQSYLEGLVTADDRMVALIDLEQLFKGETISDLDKHVNAMSQDSNSTKKGS